MPVQMNNIRTLVVLYWRHSQFDQENSWTKELRDKLNYDDELRIRYRHDIKFVFANINRRTESYQTNKDIIERLRRYKEKAHPLVFIDLIFPNENFSREEKYVINNGYDVEQVMKRIRYLVLEYEK